jgi:hypothetical protein
MTVSFQATNSIRLTSGLADLRRSREFSGVVPAERLFRRGLYRFSYRHTLPPH